MYGIIFLGTSDFAVPSLRALCEDGRFEILAVVTQPDRPVGRHAVVTEPPVKVLAKQNGIRVFQPEKIEELRMNADFSALLSPRPDAFVVVSYGKILPQWFLDLPTHGIVNVHGSLLPRWRGASPIQAAIAAGDKTTGVTVMKIDADMDHGPILATESEPILATDTGGFLHDRLAAIVARILPDTLAKYLDGGIVPVEQDHAHATVCRQLTRDDGKIDFNMMSEQIERKVRAYNPWPGTWADIGGKRLKILAVRIRPNNECYPVGGHFSWKDSPHVCCGRGTSIELVTVQPEGGTPMSGQEFLRGNQYWTGV